MTGAAHASIGAAIGSLVRRPGLAFLAGILSHVIADIVPHKDFTVKTEVPLLAATVLAIGARYGFDSPQFWGALGAVSPDFEHGLTELGIMPKDWERFPTHIHDGKYHGPETNEQITQLIAAAASLVIAEACRSG